MFVEILFLVIIFLLAAVTKSLFFYALLIAVFLLCLPGIIALNSAPYVPTLKKNADTMIKLAEIKPGKKVYDLGAGDGKLVIKAAQKGASAIGYEISFALFIFFWLKKAIVRNKGKVYWGNIWRKDLSEADVVLCFLMPRAMARFERDKYSTMKKGSRLVSNIFPLPHVKPNKSENNVYVYIKK
ncbi:hypothetical protein C4544_00290 [candidate division WS5 bacterium]|uniref:SAM-dependent methyltransferase n=1 Tax=candidate division WS5 bacterium TaxID=2093353 RepID=A0A419DGN0_9BACT|nr:MAG: hypothetical protein C4544_00290 [candidate division WS5 bacterium]